jgi:hypothetical protein
LEQISKLGKKLKIGTNFENRFFLKKWNKFELEQISKLEKNLKIGTNFEIGKISKIGKFRKLEQISKNWNKISKMEQI